MPDDRPNLPAGLPPAPNVPPAPPLSPPMPPPTPPATAISAEPMAMAPISLDPAATKPLTTPVPTGTAKDAEQKDSFRELIETVVFVVVLVLMLKTFLAEAFVIPTGSMAVTLLGYHHQVVCKECGRPFLANASDEADPQRGQPQRVVSCECENCGARNHLVPPPPPRGGQQ